MNVVACNCVGDNGATQFFGHSMMIDPWGEVVAEGSEEEMILKGTLSMEDVTRVRATIPVFADRRPDLYK